MKRCIFCVWTIVFCGSVPAQTINWYVDGEIYQTTTCSAGDDVTPPSAPARRGYTFTGWREIIVGTWRQSGTPTPSNPIYPTFYQDGDLILRAVGAGAATAADTYNAETGKIIRFVGVKVLDGTENWDRGVNTLYADILSDAASGITTAFSTHYIYSAESAGSMPNGSFKIGTTGIVNRLTVRYTPTLPAIADFKQYLADQYAAGTPVTVFYPLATPVEETYTPSSN